MEVQQWFGKHREALAVLALVLEDSDAPLPCSMDNICWIYILESPFITDCISCIIGPSLTLLIKDRWPLLCLE